jgi:hypothetical protein
MAVIDSPGGNANAQIQAGPLERPIKAYPWTCTNPDCPNPNQIGRVEDGCAACGAGADAIAGQPLAPTDFNCAACRGSGTVERKCGACEGTGMTDPPQLGEPPPACEKCGGSGGVAFTCGRCDGSGIDPAPATKPGVALDTAPPVAAALPTPVMPPSQAGIFKTLATAVAKDFVAAGLPSIDPEQPAVTSPDTVVRYRLIRYEGPRDWAERTIDRSLEGRHSYPIGANITAIEIAEPSNKGIQIALATAAQVRRWPAVDEKY